MALTNLLLLRHGEAFHGTPDETRELTENGREEVERSLSKSLQRIPKLDVIYQSGLVRAAQTAAIAAEILAPHLTPGYLQGMSPQGNPEQFVKTSQIENVTTCLLVTHNPFVEDLVEYLTGQSVRIKTGTLVNLEVDFLARGCCDIAWVQH